MSDTRPDDNEFTEVNAEQQPAPEVNPDTLEKKAVEAEEENPEPPEAKPDEEGLRDDKGRFKGAQARIDELTRARREAERERDYYKGLAAPKQAPQTGSEAAPAQKPTADQYGDYGDYVEALTDWKADQRDAQRNTAEATRSADRAADLQRQAWATKVSAVETTLTDYAEIVGNSDLPIAGHVAEALMEADRGPELAYYFAQHQHELAKLNAMSNARAAIELGRIEATLGGQPPAKAVTKAPAPITPVRGGIAGRTNLAEADMDTYIAERRKQGATY